MRVFLMLLALLFIGLKAGGVVAWSWWLVLAPLMAWVVIVAVIAAFWLFLLRRLF